ncbi:unnamed protein product [Oikopleura dioica]|uniref:Uncharacterized protein n=1 Tax=Oikopleura dioica TaxID=34765 RepID=E4WV16_OIKDI|nr:unnamed protein product [Oikopleura dioica]CBY41914.1 unnamed protein product [Oikopleura dioica]
MLQLVPRFLTIFKIEKLSSEVKDSNPYSRLMALQRMGIVKNYEDIRAKTVIVVGVGDADSLWNRKADPFRLR